MFKLYFFEDSKYLYSKTELSSLGYSLLRQFYGQDIIIEKNDNGKPYITNKQKLFFNLSHSKNGLALAISDCEIGVDIEKIKEFNKSVAKRFLKTDETDDLKLLKLWTKLESAIKFKGLNLSYINKVHIENTKTIEIGDFVISYCTESKENPEIIKIDEKTIKKF